MRWKKQGVGTKLGEINSPPSVNISPMEASPAFSLRASSHAASPFRSDFQNLVRVTDSLAAIDRE
jgi:hypothetical protein